MSFLWAQPRTDRISGSGSISNKKNLWINAKSYRALGDHGAHGIMPETYILPKQYHEIPNGETFIYKTHSQRQEGLFVTSHKPSIDIINSEKFTVAQRFIIDTLTYKGHKVTARMYIVIYVDPKPGGIGRFRYHIPDDGMIYYSRYKYDADSKCIYHKIASFSDSLNLYDIGFPITINTFGLKRKVRLNMIKQLKVLPKLLSLGTAQIGTYQLFGVDFHIGSDGQTYMLEVNSGPGMKAHNEDDKRMRDMVLNSVRTHRQPSTPST